MQDWEMAMKHQRKNGSLFNSPATTASAFTHLNDSKCFDYLSSLVSEFGGAGQWILDVIIIIFLCLILILTISDNG